MSKYIIDVEDNNIKSCKLYEPIKFEEDKIRADERERIIKKLKDTVKHEKYDHVVGYYAGIVQAIRIVKGEK